MTSILTNCSVNKLICFGCLYFLPVFLLAQPVKKRATVQENRVEIANSFNPIPLLKTTTFQGSCNTWTFMTELFSSKKERPSDIIQLPGSSYIIGGSSNAGGNLSGRLIKLSEDGNVLKSKELTMPGYQVEVNRLHYYAIGKIYGIGTITDASNSASFPALFSIDTGSLSIQFFSRLNVSGGPADWKGFDLTENPMDSTVFVLLNNDSLINVTKLKPDLSTVAWSKTYRPKNTPRMVGIGIEALDVFVAWNETDSGYSKGVVANLDPTTGNFKYGSKVGGPSQQVNIELQGMCVINLRPRFTALEWDNSATRLLRINYEVFAYPTFKEYFTIAGLTPNSASFSQQNEWGESLAFQQTTGSTDITVIQTFPDNDYNDPVRASVINYPSPVQLKRQRHAFDGGNITLAESANGIMLCKADSAINLPSCSANPVAASSVRTLNKLAYMWDTPATRALVFQPMAINVSETDLPLSQNLYCKTQFCPTVKEPDSCQRTFFKEYRNSTNCIVATQLTKLGNDFLLAGNSRLLPYSGYGTFSLIKMDTGGQVKDARVVWAPNLNVYKTIPLHDGNFLLFGSVGSSFSFSELFFAKTDSQFNIIWQQKLTSNPFFNGVSEVVESKEGDFYCYLIDHETSWAESRDILKLDPSGKPVWLKKFNVSANAFAGTGEFIPAIVELGDNVVLKYNDEDGDMSPYLMSLRKTDGTINWVRKYQMTGPYYGSGSYALNSLLSDGANLYMLGRTQEHDLFLKIRPDGTVSLAKTVVNATVYCGLMSLKTNGHLLVDVSNNGVPSVNGVIEMDTSFQILRSQYMHKPKNGRGGGVIDVNDSLVYEAGSLWDDNSYWASVYFQKYNFNSSFSTCTVTDPVFVLDSIHQPTFPKTLSGTSVSLPAQNSAAAILYPLSIAYAAYYCGNNPLCSKVQLQGPTKICDSTNTYTFKPVRNPGCNGFVIWRMDTAASQVKLISVSDSALELKLTGGGHFKIHSRVFATCGWLEDSISVEGSLQNASLNLGRDTVLCPGNSLQLHAGAGFASYQWQDGSTDSLFTVHSPGLYYVQVSSCNSSFSDTVLIAPHPPIVLEAGGDRVKCNTDTLHLNATSGFLNYWWGPNYHIDSTNGATAVVDPMVDTSYFIKAEKTPGCFAYDTVSIKVYASPKIDLGRDTSFCDGNFIVLATPPLFASYNWSTGETSSQINVSKAGSYFVVATTAQGCSSSDTLAVTNVYPLPVVLLDQNPALCYGGSRLLDPGSFNSYLWQDGSTNRTRLATSNGEYYVKVWDQHGCSNSDTTIITTILPLPSAFLPRDTSLCSYETLTIKPTSSYRQYLWSNGASTSSIDISRAGVYWLQVTDAQGCKGADSIVVNPKECMVGMHIPSAFTPNGDAHNDEFRALAFGNLKTFEFIIYNRWGQMIFKTNDRFKGWDGKLAGIEQRSDVYVWTCRYQFEGEPEQFKKGTVTLIR